MNLQDVPAILTNYAPAIGVALFAIPSYWGVLRQKKFIGLLLLIVLGLYAIGIETLAIKTGSLYGNFSYTDILGAKVFGTTPWIVALAYPPVLLVAFWFASKFTRSFGRVFIASIFATIIDLVLDPATVKLQFWTWDTPGAFYGVPWTNFVGWLATAFIGALIIHLIWGKAQRVKAPVAYSGLAVLLFWTGVNIGVNQFIPVGLGIFYSIVIVFVLILEKQQFRDEAK